MPATIEVGNTLKMRGWCISANQASVNTWYYLVSNVTGAPVLNDMATAFDAILSPLMIALIVDQAEYRGVQCYVDQVPLPTPGQSIAGAGVGTNGTVALPTQSCGITTWLTDYAGVSLRGRTYWPFPSTTEDAVGGAPTSGYITLMTAASNGLKNVHTLTGSSGACTVTMMLHRGKNKAGVPQPQEAITDFRVNAKWATQRRRGIGYGRPNVSPI